LREIQEQEHIPKNKTLHTFSKINPERAFTATDFYTD